MLVAGSVLYVLFPPVHGGYLRCWRSTWWPTCWSCFRTCPGGWGVFEAVMMTLLKRTESGARPPKNMPKVFAGIIVFRVIYFLLPLLFAAAMVGWHEYALRKKWIPRLMASPADPADGAARPEGMNGHAGKDGTAEVKRHVPSE